MAKVNWKNVSAGIFAGGFFGLPLIVAAWVLIGAGIDYVNVTCSKEPIAYQTITTDDSTLEQGKQIIDFEGLEGSKEICRRKNGDMANEKVLVTPQNRLVRNGTYTKPWVPTPTYFTQPIYDEPSGGGAICMDGTRSYSTGRGTCSHHGGVDYWL